MRYKLIVALILLILLPFSVFHFYNYIMFERILAHGGKLVYVGLVKSDISFTDPEFHKREMTLISSRNATREDFETVIDAINSGKIHVEEYITHRADFSHMIEHFHAWLKPTSHVIKAMVEINQRMIYECKALCTGGIS